MVVFSLTVRRRVKVVKNNVNSPPLSALLGSVPFVVSIGDARSIEVPQLIDLPSFFCHPGTQTYCLGLTIVFLGLVRDPLERRPVP